MELVYDRADEPATVLVFLAIYGVVQLLAAQRYGPKWYERGDGFEVYSTLVARLSPFGRRSDGRLVVRSPLDGLAGLTPAPGLLAVICVLLGSTAFDGVTRTQYWQDLTTAQPAVANLLGTARQD